MPYIPSEQRPAITSALSELPGKLSAGQLNFLFTQLADQYIRDNGLSYATLNDMVGALECCKLELYRRIAAPYEDVKIAKNGDAYPLSLPLLREAYGK